MSDIASADLPDVGSLQPPPDLPDVGSLTEAPQAHGFRGGGSNFSAGVRARMNGGDALSRTISKLGQGFATGYGDSFAGITADDQQTMIDAGIKPVTAGEIGTVGGTLRFYGQSLMAAASSVKAAVFSLYGGVQGAVEQGVTQAAKEAGAENPERVGAEAAGFTEFVASDAHVNTMLLSRAQYAEATRIAPNPATGGFYDQRIGPVPDHVEAAQQAATVAGHYGLHDPIESAAIKVGDNVYSGPTHADALAAAAKVETGEAQLNAILENPNNVGYVTKSGQFVPESRSNLTSSDNIGVTATIQAAYDKGVLPAEIFHDAKANPTVLADLVEGNVPEAYPVSDWMGAETAPEAATAPKVIEAPEGTPTPQVPAGKLPAGAPRPVAGTGDLETRGLSESTEAVAINKGLADEFSGLPTYRAVKDTDQGAMALKFLNDDPEGALQVAMGTKAAPKGLLPEAAYVAVKNKAVAEGDVDTLRTLATQSTLTQQATTMGQRISYLRNVNPETDPVAAIQQVQDTRAAALKAKGIDLPANENAVMQEYAPIRAAARAYKPNKWNDFLQSITCKE